MATALQSIRTADQDESTHDALVRLAGRLAQERAELGELEDRVRSCRSRIDATRREIASLIDAECATSDVPPEPERLRVTLRTGTNRFAEILGEFVASVKTAEQKLGRPRKPLADIVFASVLIAYSCLSSRNVAPLLRCAQDDGYIEGALSPKTICRYMEDSDLTETLERLVAATSTTATADSLYYVAFGPIENRTCVRAHYSVDEATGAITSLVSVGTALARKEGARGGFPSFAVFSDRIRAKSFVSQRNECLCRAIAHNIWIRMSRPE